MCIQSFNVYTFEFKWKLLLGCFLHFPNGFTSFPRDFKVVREITTSFPLSFHITVSMQSCRRSSNKGHQFANVARGDGVQMVQELLCMCCVRNLCIWLATGVKVNSPYHLQSQKALAATVEQKQCMITLSNPR